MPAPTLAPMTQPQRSVVTGANRGLGLALVETLLVRGSHVVAGCRHPGKATDLNRLAGEHPGRLHVLPLDVADPKSVAEFAREVPMSLDGIDLLVNNAGVLQAGERFGKVEARHLEDSFRTNAMGPFLLAQALAPQFAEGATLANITSELGSIAGVSRFGTPSYNIGKAAQNMASALLRHALAERKVTVLALHPGWVRTDMGGKEASVAPVESAAGLMKVIDGATFADSGRYLDFKGNALDW